MSYNRDLQEDKGPCLTRWIRFAIAWRYLRKCWRTRFNAVRMHSAAGGGFSATDIAEYGGKACPFTAPTEIAGGIVAYCIKTKRTLEDLTLGEYQSFYDGFDESILSRIKLENAVAARSHFGGTAQKAVRERIREFEKKLGRK